MGSSGGGGQTSNTTIQKSDPWSGQQPYLQNIYSRAMGSPAVAPTWQAGTNPTYDEYGNMTSEGTPGQWVGGSAAVPGLVDTPMSYYEGNTVAGFTPQQQLAQSLATQRALAGNQNLKSAQQLNIDTMSGKYMNADTNPYLQNLLTRSLEDSLPALRGQAAQAGRFGSPDYNQMASRTMADAMTNVYLPERQYQMQAIQNADALGKADYYDIGQLAAVGEEQQALNQAMIQEAMNRWQFNQMEPWNRLNLASNLIQGHQGGTTTMTSPYYQPSQSSRLLGGAAAGAGLGSMVAGAGNEMYGAGIGGLLGGIGGML